MRNSSQHLDDEHMKLYEWSGAGTSVIFSMPPKSKRTHPWHASYAMLAVMASLMTPTGHSIKIPVKQTGMRVALKAQQENSPPHTLLLAFPATAGTATSGTAGGCPGSRPGRATIKT
ncbi:MAG: hypothetical protein QG662_127 [Pseudomonadota bacterium]|nr:hypothetical protein [Pseudomonadota bacterium]